MYKKSESNISVCCAINRADIRRIYHWYTIPVFIFHVLPWEKSQQRLFTATSAPFLQLVQKSVQAFRLHSRRFDVSPQAGFSLPQGKTWIRSKCQKLLSVSSAPTFFQVTTEFYRKLRKNHVQPIGKLLPSQNLRLKIFCSFFASIVFLILPTPAHPHVPLWSHSLKLTSYEWRVCTHTILHLTNPYNT